MQETNFDLNNRPFSSDIRVDRYFPAEAIEAARQAVALNIERADGCSLIVGPPGTGKTMLCHVLAEQFGQQFASVVLAGGRLASRKALLQAILYELGLPYRRLDEGELRLAMIDHLSPRDDGSRGMLLLVDEAHTLSPKLLEELRLLTNLVRQGMPRVRLVLAGGAVLEERFASPRLESFNQRLTSRCYLEPFSSQETQQFVRAQVSASGKNPDAVFDVKALQEIHRATDGVARLIVQLCDHALLLATAGATAEHVTMPIGQRGIEEAWADLQQLPMPWNVESAAGEPDSDASSSAPAAETIEFGELDEDEFADGELADGESGLAESEVAHDDADAADGGRHADHDRHADHSAGEAARQGPTEQIDHIQDQLQRADADFEPVVRETPELEVAFADAGDREAGDWEEVSGPAATHEVASGTSASGAAHENRDDLAWEMVVESSAAAPLPMTPLPATPTSRPAPVAPSSSEPVLPGGPSQGSDDPVFPPRPAADTSQPLPPPVQPPVQPPAAEVYDPVRPERNGAISAPAVVKPVPTDPAPTDSGSTDAVPPRHVPPTPVAAGPFAPGPDATDPVTPSPVVSGPTSAPSREGAAAAEDRDATQPSGRRYQSLFSSMRKNQRR